MMLALVLGFLVGSFPSADLIGKIAGVDLRSQGSGNPGTANALRVGGARLAVPVLVLDLLKGVAAALIGLAVDGDRAALAAGFAAVAGQVHNPWFRFRGGKGLGVTAGVSLVVWPLGLAAVVVVIASASAMLRSARGGLIGILAYVGLAVLWAFQSLPVAWGVPADDGLVWFALGVAALTLPKFIEAVRLGR